MSATSSSATLNVENEAKTSTKKEKKSPKLDSAAPKAEKKTSSRKKMESILPQLLNFDADMRKKWLRNDEATLLGTDEVGRGCLAGPVVAVAVKLPAISKNEDLHELLSRLNDSKKLSATAREELAEVLRRHCDYAVAEASVDEIDEINILQASFVAMNRAINKLSVSDSSVVLVDGNQKVSRLELRQILVVGGDGISASIAAASIIAKVHRDKLMSELHNDFPHYNWFSNKGYGSKDHRDAIHEHGLTVWHRKSFCERLMNEQLSLIN